MEIIMKRLFTLLFAVLLVPLVLCACFKAEIEDISLSKTNVEMIVGESVTITVTASPDEAEVKKISWSSSDNNVATVEDGTIKAKAFGTALVTAQTENGIKEICNVTVREKSVEAVVLSDSSTSVKKGSKIQLTAKVQPADAADYGLEWSSEDESIATVNEDGFVEGKKVGVTNIVCTTSNGKTATCTVTVKSGKPITPTAPTSESVSESTAPNTDEKASETDKRESSLAEHSGDVFPESSSRNLSESEVAGISGEQAQAAINEIFARNGYIFKSSELQSYYESKSWYAPDPNFSESKFNSYESYNISLFTKYR